MKAENDGKAFLSRGTAFELNRALGLFYPVTRAAYNNGNDPLLKDGIRRLSNKRDDRFYYSMVSIETVVSADEDMQAQANQRKARVTTGPLALVCCDPASVTLNPTHDGEIDFAEELSAPAPDRLDVGIDTDDGSVQWYSASPRVVLYHDPHPAKKGDEEWPQLIIESLTPNWLPPFERDAHGLTFSSFQQKGKDGKLQAPCFDPRMAAYSGEAVGARSKSINTVGKMPQWETTPVRLERGEDLVVSQQIEVLKHGELLPLLRFGWRYHFGIRRSFLGGAGPTLQRAAAVYDARGSDAPFPAVTKEGGGFHYLRHDPIAKPIVMLAPEVPVRGKGKRIELQTSAQMVLVSRRKGGPRVDYTARILVVPSVDPPVAATHEVFDEIGAGGAVHSEIFVSMRPEQQADQQACEQQEKLAPKQLRLPLATHAPPQGLKNVRLYYDDPPPAACLQGQHRFQFGAGERRATPYYPDPAACYLVLRLQHPERPNVWLTPPLVVLVRGEAANEKHFAWPNLLPVRVDLYAADERRGKGLELTGGEIIQENGQLFRRVVVSLLPGESAILKAWAAPDAEDLLSWFDVIERSAQLCSSEACNCSPGLECATGRQSLLGDKSGPLQEDEEDRRQIANLYHQRLIEAPVFLFADVADIHLIHATDLPWHPACFVDTPRVARPSGLERDRLSDFLMTAGPAAEWGPAKADDEATAVIAGGIIEFDQVTTSGLVIEAAMVQPGSGVLDPVPPATPAQFVPKRSKKIAVENGNFDFGPQVWSEVLRIQGIPLPADGRAGPRPYALEELMLGSVAEMKTAKIQYGAPLHTGQARQACFRIIPLPRYASMLSGKANELPSVLAADGKDSLYPATDSVWIPATIRPAAPDVKALIPTFTWTDSGVSAGMSAARITSSRTRSTALRLVLRRPWFSTGEGERIGIVFWPPSVLDLASPYASHEIEVPSREALRLLSEEDVGPVGRFISVWGFDPIEPIDTDPDGNPHETIERPRFLSPEDFVLPPGAIKHSRVLMPLPGATAGKNDEHFVAVSLVSLPLTFEDGAVDPYVDIELTPIDGVPDPIIRLGVVRIQLNARLDAVVTGLSPDPSNWPAIRCSAPVSVQSQFPPARKLSVTATELGAMHGADGDQTSISVALSGPAAPLVSKSSDTRVVIELVEHISGNEVAVRTIGGNPTRKEGGADDGNLHHEYQAGEATWTASFLLPGKLGSRQIIARAQEDVLMESANPSAHAKRGQMPRYFGQLGIKPPVIAN